MKEFRNVFTCESVPTERNGEWRIVVEGGPPCQVLDITPEALHDSEALLHGNLFEIEEDELDAPPDALVPLIAASQMVDLLGKAPNLDALIQYMTLPRVERAAIRRSFPGTAPGSTRKLPGSHREAP